MPPLGSSKIPRASGCIRRDSSWYNWINLTQECQTCEYKKDKTCSFGGVLRKIFTKGKIRVKCLYTGNEIKYDKCL